MSIMTEKAEDFPKNEEPFGLGCALDSFSEVDEVLEMIKSIGVLTEANTPISVVERAYERFVFILSQYQEQPHLLDSHNNLFLDKFVSLVRNPKSSMESKHLAFKYMSILIKVRGYKVIVCHLPHEVSDFEPVLQLLENQDPTDTETWTTRYVLLLWLSIIVIIPFHMSRFDAFDSNNEDNSEKTVMNRVLNICKTYAVVSDKCRDAAAYLSAKFLTRSDVKDKHLSAFFNWAEELSTSHRSTVFMKYGCLACIAMILKHGKREDLLPHAQKLLTWIISAEFKNNTGTNIQKLVYKNIQRIGLTFLPTRIASWRYQRGNRSLAANLSAGDSDKSAGVVKSGNSAADPTDEDGTASDNIDVPDEVEEVIDQLIQGLRCNDGVVRWSAAKGIGRITGRLPKELADEVVGSVLELFNLRESDGAWHGGCLALAELGRRGLLLPQRLPEVVPMILKALIYDEPRGYSSVGSHIRDAACYVCWSFARAYETDILQPFVNDIASALVVVTCFDREINCRRAASAAFQENVGRQGTFPHGIDILTTADFFNVSVRNNAYLNISVYIAQYDEYAISLIDHLVHRKVEHWDIAIRELAAKSLHSLTAKNPEYMVNIALYKLFEKANSIDLNCRHGSVLAIGELIYSLSKIGKEEQIKIDDILGNDIIQLLKNLIPTYHKKLYFRGMGGELMRQACSDLIEKCSLSQLPFYNNDILGIWLKLLEDCLSYDVVNIRMGAIAALPVLLSEYFSGTSQEDLNRQTVILDNYMGELSTNNQIVRMGYSLALGAMPAFMLRSQLNSIIDSLSSTASITAETLKWAETRRDAIKALTSICVTLEDELGKSLDATQLNRIFNIFLEGLKEYTQDNRGDIGAWVREASMTGLQVLTLLLAKRCPELLYSKLVAAVVTGVAQQAVEKIDRTRALAGKIFYGFLHSEEKIPNIPNHEILMNIFSKEECEILNWNSAAVTFPLFVQLLQFPEFVYHVMLGFVSSVGGLTETLVKNASGSLYLYMKSMEERYGTQQIVNYCSVIYKIFCDYQKVDRISVSMFKFLNKLMGSNSINCVINDPNSDFAKKTLKLVQLEIAGCKDIYKLIDGMDLLCQFIQIKSEVCGAALVQLCILLCHRQRYVRRSTSSKLYESLLVYGDSGTIPEENLDEIMNLLSSTNWEDAVEDIKPVRNELCRLMNICTPVPKKSND